MTLTVTAECLAYRFNATTTASWTGHFTPMFGSPTADFTISYSAAEVLEQSGGEEARVVLGTGTGALPSGIADLGPGSFEGTITAQFAPTRSLTASMNVAITSDPSSWKTLEYTDSPFSMTPPTVGSTTNTPFVLPLSRRSNVTPIAESVLRAATTYHHAIQVCVARNASSMAVAPSSISVRIASYNASDVRIATSDPIIVTRVLPDSDPDCLFYQSDVNVPVILCDHAITPSLYTTVIVLEFSAGGGVRIIPNLEP